MFIKKMTKSLLALLLAASMLVLCACGNSNSDTSTTGTTESIPQTPEEKFEKAGKDITNGIIDPVFAVFEALENATPENLSQAGKMSLQVRLGETISQSLYSMSGMDFSWIENASIDISYAMKDQILGEDIALSYNKNPLIGISVIMDEANQVGYISVPQLFDQTLKMDLSEFMGTDVSMAMGELSILENLPDMEKVRTILNKYIDLILTSVDNIAESKGTLEIGGISEDCTLLTVTLTAKDLADLAKKVLETASTDADIQTIITEFAECMNAITGDSIDISEAYPEFQSFITNTITELDHRIAEATEEELNEAMILTEYIDSNYGLTGMKIEVPSDGEENNVIFIGAADKDGKTRVNFYVTDQGTTISEFNLAIDETDTTYKANFEMLGNDESIAAFEIDLKKEGETVSGDLEVFMEEDSVFGIGIELTESGNTISGHLEFIVEEESMFFIDIENLDTKKLEEGNVNGIISLSPSKGLLDMLEGMLYGSGIPSNILSSFALSFNFEDNDATISLKGGSEEYFAIILSMETSDVVDIQIPTNTTEDMDAWAISMDMQKFLENIGNAGLPEDIMQLILMMFYGYSM